MLAAAKLEERVALPRIRAFVEKQSGGAVAFVNRLGPVRGKREAQSIELHVAELAARDAPGAHALTVTARGGRAEFTRATAVAVARLKKVGLDAPFGL